MHFLFSIVSIFHKILSYVLGHEKQPTLPLIRVRVEYKDEEQTFNTIRFGQRFHSKVANPTDIVLLKREKKASTRRTKNDDRDEREELDELLENESVLYFSHCETKIIYLTL